MTFSERMKELFEHGWTISKDLAAKASEKAQDMSEKGIIKWDIKQLESQAQKLITRLGNKAYIAFTEQNQTTLERDSLEIRITLEEIATIKEQIEKKERELKNR
ncbi:MAG: hypothetical protein LBC80_02125 [Treponema sp.]|jgi:hypothetical protein|nr:hypothetical protein [Treponema sp.]